MLLMILKKIFFQINDQFYLWKSKEKFMKKNQCENNNEKDFLKYTGILTHITRKIFDKDFATIHEIKLVLILNKPIYVEFTVLDLGKWNMYDFLKTLLERILMLNFYLLTQTVLLMK